MPAKAIRPDTEEISCAVCGRRLLQGERPETYLASGTRRMVCELCTLRANHQGWIREAAGPQLGHRGTRREERRSRFARFRGRRDREAASDGSAPDGSPESAAPDEEPAVADRPREPRHVHAVPTSEELKAARAVELFNTSEHPRTVAGVSRSLGPASVAVRPEADHPSVVSIVVAWELCWYRYEVDLAGEGLHGVRQVQQGYELTELGPDDQAPNAAADEHGALVLAD